MCLSAYDLVCDECRKKQEDIFKDLEESSPPNPIDAERKAREEWYKSLCKECRKVLKEEGFI